MSALADSLPQSDDPAALWPRIVPHPESRSVLFGQTGSGKSTLGGAMLREYHRFFPRHRIIVIDPKVRFFPFKGEKRDPLFPDGIHPKVHGGLRGVAIKADLIRGLEHVGPARVGVVHNLNLAEAVFEHLFEISRVQRPTMLFLDEVLDFQNGAGRGIRSYRRVMQLGRERGIGVISIHQDPAYVDRSLLTQVQRLYVGVTHNPKDRKKLSDVVADERCKALLLRPIEEFHFLLCNQQKPAASFMFHLTRG